jgi:hypothetical protein
MDLSHGERRARGFTDPAPSIYTSMRSSAQAGAGERWDSSGAELACAMERGIRRSVTAHLLGARAMSGCTRLERNSKTWGAGGVFRGVERVMYSRRHATFAAMRRFAALCTTHKEVRRCVRLGIP